MSRSEQSTIITRIRRDGLLVRVRSTAVAGAGKVDSEGGGGLEYRFSPKLSRVEREGIELVESSDDTERLVFRLSRISADGEIVYAALSRNRSAHEDANRESIPQREVQSMER